MKMKVQTLMIVVVLLFGGSCTESKEEDNVGRSKRSMKVAMFGDQREFDPGSMMRVMEFLRSQCVYQNLVRIDERGEIVGDLAKSWRTDANGSVFEFTLAKGAKFSNGHPVTSLDVVYSLSRHGWPSSRSIIKNYFSDVVIGFNGLKENEIPKGIEAVSDDVVRFRLKGPYPPFLSVLTMPGFAVVPKDEGARKSLVGSGPMTATLNGAERKWVYKTNQNYIGNRAPLKEIEIRFTEDPADLKSLVKEWGADTVMGMPFAVAEELQRMESYTITYAESLSTLYAFTNSESDLFKSLKVRRLYKKALQNAVASIGQVNELMSPQLSFIPAGIMPPSYHSGRSTDGLGESEQHELAEAIEKNGGLRLSVTRGFLSSMLLGKINQKLSEISENFKLIEISSLKDHLFTGDYEVILFAYLGNFSDPDGFLDPLKMNNIPGINVPSHELFSSIQKNRFDVDGERRLKAYAARVREFEEQAWVVPLYRVKFPIVHKTDVVIPETKYRYEAELYNYLWK